MCGPARDGRLLGGGTGTDNRRRQQQHTGPHEDKKPLPTQIE